MDARRREKEHRLWTAYLDECRRARDKNSKREYEDVEPWAWQRLQEGLLELARSLVTKR